MSNSSDDRRQFREQREKNIERMAKSEKLEKLRVDFFEQTAEYDYTYSFEWMGVPIIQYPQDMIACQELIWKIKPQVIVETGIARGGSIIYYASLLEMLGNDGIVVGVDIDIRDHNRDTIETHPMNHRIRMVEGSSVDPETVAKVKEHTVGKGPIMVFLDSMHTHDHVLEELRLYNDLVEEGSYLVVFDTIVEDLPKDYYADRPWDVGNNPKTAVHAFLKENDRFEIDKNIAGKIVATCNPDGYLCCIK